MNKRSLCEHCRYPLKTCICDAISRVDNQTFVTVLQDPTEVKHAKNTARLLPLVLSQCQIIVGERFDGLSSLGLPDSIANHTVVAFPTKGALSPNELSAQEHVIRHIILLDGTWRKARKMWLSNSWLHALPAVQLQLESASQYTIRKSPITDGLSTLEAAEQLLQSFEDGDFSPLSRVLNAMQSHWTMHQPDNAQ